MANGYDMAKALVTALRADTKFTAYCTSALSTIPWFYVGLDMQTLPKETKIPFVAIVPDSEQVVDNQYVEHVLKVGAVVEKSAVTTATATKTISFDGYDLALDFSKILLDAIQRAIETSEASTASTTMSMSDWSPARIACHYPLFHTTREITLTTAYTLPT
jgi:hypothetical protein